MMARSLMIDVLFLVGCYLYKVAPQTCLTDADGCNPPVPCNPGALLPYPPDCRRYQTCISSYQWMLDETDLCSSKGPFNNITCECDNANACYEEDCPPTTGTQVPPIESMPCAANLTHCDVSMEDETVYDRFYCTSYFRCISTIWVQEFCPEDTPYYYPASPDGEICVNNPARCSETTECVFTLPYVSTTEQMTTSMPSTTELTSTEDTTTTLLSTIHVQTTNEVTSEHATEVMTSYITSLPDTTMISKETTIISDVSSSITHISEGPTEVTTGFESDTSTAFYVTTEILVDTSLATSDSNDATSWKGSSSEFITDTGTAFTGVGTDPIVTSDSQTNFTSEIIYTTSEVTITGVNEISTSISGTDPTTSFDDVTFVTGVSEISTSISATDPPTSLDDLTMVTEVTEVFTPISDPSVTEPSTSHPDIETSTVHLTTETMITTESYDSCEPLSVGCSPNDKVADTNDCRIYYECTSEGIWVQQNCEDANDKKPHFSTWKKKCQQHYLVDCTKRCNVEGMEVKKRNIIIASVCGGGGIIIILTTLICCCKGRDKAKSSTRDTETLNDKSSQAPVKETGEFFDIRSKYSNASWKNPQVLELDTDISGDIEGLDVLESPYVSSGHVYRPGSDADSVILDNPSYLRSLSSGPKLSESNVIDV